MLSFHFKFVQTDGRTDGQTDGQTDGRTDRQKERRADNGITICHRSFDAGHKKFSKFFTSSVFVYKSMSLKRLRIEQLCPSIDSISLVFVHYAIM